MGAASPKNSACAVKFKVLADATAGRRYRSLQGIATELRRSIGPVQEAVSAVSGTQPWLSSRSGAA